MGLLIPMMVYIRALFLPRHRLALESVALRQQLTVFKRKQPRPRINPLDRLLWIALRRWYSGWAEALILVKPETVVSLSCSNSDSWFPNLPFPAISNGSMADRTTANPNAGWRS